MSLTKDIIMEKSWINSVGFPTHLHLWKWNQWAAPALAGGRIIAGNHAFHWIFSFPNSAKCFPSFAMHLPQLWVGRDKSKWENPELLLLRSCALVLRVFCSDTALLSADSWAHHHSFPPSHLQPSSAGKMQKSQEMGREKSQDWNSDRY